ncbi:RNA-binding protein [Thalassotalea sp. G2M2-11]|uniref:RNA recognition motif domain-containing protein n=1 Tax=Thalassotalea sp. G2M2-11 TaxID=2787627 RepID=UPI0019D09D98|nr:RNA-binding protein [Thalassotalea sp. G2M2-11]
MKVPQGITIVVALILAVIGFFIAGAVELSPALIAVLLFASALIPSFFGSSVANGEDNGEVKTLYVGNLPYRANEGAVRALFSDYGNVHSVRLMKDKHTGKRRGFGFVEMSASDAEHAISKLNDSEFQQRTLKVREAKERPDKPTEE